MRQAKLALAALACGAAPLVTNVSCNPNTGYFDFFRDDDSGYFYDDYYGGYYGGYYDPYYGYGGCDYFICF